MQRLIRPLLGVQRPMLARTLHRTMPRLEQFEKIDEETAALARKLSWTDYLKARKSKNLYGYILSVPTVFFGVGFGVNYYPLVDEYVGDLIDPIFQFALVTMFSGGAGYLVGPVFGTALWKLVHRKSLPFMDAKDKLFFNKIKKYRGNPSFNSVSNPVPDYYGERIGSIRQYRQWLRDQATYQRKARFGKDQ